MNDNEVEIKVTGTNTSGPALKAAKDDTDKLGTSAEKTALKLKEEGSQASVLERKLLELKLTAKALGDEFSKTGNADVLKKFNQTTKEAGGIEKFAKDFEKLGKSLGSDVMHGAEEATQQVEGLGSQLLGLIPGGVAVKGVAIALAALPAVASAAGAALAGVGLIGIGAGVAGAVRQAPQISQAFNAELNKVQSAWAEGSASFIDPTIKSVHILGDAINKLPIQKTLSDLSQYTTGISTGVASALSSIGNGVANLMHSAAPVLKALGPDIAGLGTSVEKALNSIGTGAQGDAEALTQMIHVLDATIEVVGKLVGWFGQAYHEVDKFAHGVTDVVAEISKFDPILKPLSNWFGMWDDRQPAAFGSVLPGVSQGLDDTSKSAEDAAAALKVMNDAMSTSISQALGLEDANVAVAAGFDDLAKAVRGHGRTLDINTEAGRSNIGTVTDMIRKLEQQREAAIAAGNGTQQATDEANSAYSSQISQLKRVLQQMGFTTGAVDNLIDSLDAIPRDIYSTIHIRTVGGDSMDKAKQQGRQDAHGGIIGGAASGGLRSGMVEVGEAGPEILDMSGLVGATVHTTGDSARIRAGGGGYSGPGGVGAQSITLVVKAGDNSDRTRALVADIRDFVRIQGGDGSVLGVTSV